MAQQASQKRYFKLTHYPNTRLSDSGIWRRWRDPGHGAAAVAQPRQAFDGGHLHLELEDTAAAYLFHILQNHPFADGNKRTGTHAAIVFLAMNGIDLGELPEGAEELVLAVAKGEADKSAIAQYLKALLT